MIFLPTDPIHRLGGVVGGGVCGQNICYHVAAFVILFNFDMQHDHVLKQLNFDLLTPYPGSGRGVGICGQIFAAFCCIFWFPLNWYSMWPYSEKGEFWPIGPIPRVGLPASKIFGTMLLHSWFSLIWYTTWPCSDKGEFWPTDPILRVRGMGLCAQNICYHVAAFVIFFHLICNMSMFLKNVLTYWPHP